MENIRAYFNAEKYESLLFVLVGLAAIAMAVYFLTVSKESFYKGMALPLALVALIQLTVGTTVWLRSPKDILKMEQFIEKSPYKIQTEEIPRMEKVMKNFIIYHYVEMCLLLVGLILMFALKQQPYLQGLGIGLFIQAGLMLSLDFFAERRAEVYLELLRRF